MLFAAIFIDECKTFLNVFYQLYNYLNLIMCFHQGLGERQKNAHFYTIFLHFCIKMLQNHAGNTEKEDFD